jgi:predicted nucleic-acid-binding protein
MNGKNNFLLDTNVVLGFLKNNPAIKNFFQENFSKQELFVSQITAINSNLTLLTCDKDLLISIEGLQSINPCL